MQPSAAQRVAVARKLATCCRSRFGVDLGFEDITQQLQSGCDSRFCRQAKQRRAARALARISAISVFFPNMTKTNLINISLGDKHKK